jgi:peptide/nickel transport system permease protein
VVAEIAQPTAMGPVRRVLGFLKANPLITVGGSVIILLAVVGLLAPVLGTVDPVALAPGQRALLPSVSHWFGTDLLGRDVYSRVIYGTRVSLFVGLTVAIVSGIVGLLVGVIAGYIPYADLPIMRIVDGFMAIPPILLAIALMAITGAGVLNVIVAVTLAEVPRVARLTRGSVLVVRKQIYVDAAVTSGTTRWPLMWRHIVPNILTPLVIQVTFICAQAMIAEASLSFLGIGVPPDIPSWGNIMAEGRAIWQLKPHLIFFPATFLAITIFSMNLLGDGLRDLLDPRSS